MSAASDASSTLPGRHRPATSRRSRRATATLAGKIVAALVSAVLLATMGWFWYNYTSLDKGLHRVAVSGLGGAPANPVPTQGRHLGTSQNLLLIGSDSRQGLSSAQEHLLQVGNDQGTTSTDTLMVVHIPADGSRATLVSIPRDTYVPIPGHPSNKINAAFIDGYNYTDGANTDDQRFSAGMSLLIQTVKNLTGITIDHYVMVNFIGFYNIAKAIDGISVNLCHAVDDTLSHNLAEGNGHVGSGFKMSAGPHHLDPVQSLEFVRQRHNLPGVGDDIGREARQRYFLGQAFKKIESGGTLLNPSSLSDLVGAVKSTLTIDQHLSLQTLADQLLNLTGGNIVGQTIPTLGSRSFGGAVGDALIVNRAAVQAKIQAWFYGSPKPAAPSPPAGTARTSQPAGGPTPTPAGAVPAVAPNGCIN